MPRVIHFEMCTDDPERVGKFYPGCVRLAVPPGMCLGCWNQIPRKIIARGKDVALTRDQAGEKLEEHEPDELLVTLEFHPCGSQTHQC